MRIKSMISILVIVFIAIASSTMVKYENGFVKVGDMSFCASCELNETCLVTCRLNEGGSSTPICANYGQQSCACPGPVTY